jgi:hypothetical protein
MTDWEKLIADADSKREKQHQKRLEEVAVQAQAAQRARQSARRPRQLADVEMLFQPLEALRRRSRADGSDQRDSAIAPCRRKGSSQ